MSDHDHDGDNKAESEAKSVKRPRDVPSKEETLSGRLAPRIPNTEGIMFDVYGRTDVGLVREHNEDNFMLADLADDTDEERRDRLTGAVDERGLGLAVCDGMGGAAAGEVASQMAVDSLKRMLRGEGAPEDRDAFARRLVHAVEDTGHSIFAAAKKDRARRGMGTTATVAGLIDKVLFVAQVGDSRCYILRNGKLSLLTKDQSLVNQLIEAGQLTEAEAEAFEHSNIILQALGTTERVSVDLTFVELRQGDRLLLCSDGLCGFVHDDVIEETMIDTQSLPDLADKLIDLANAAGGHDNITCIVADFTGDHLDKATDAPVPFYQQYPLPLGDRDTMRSSGPSPVIKSLSPRPLAHSPTSSPSTETRAFSWPTSAAVLLLFGIAAAITVVTGRSQPIHGGSGWSVVGKGVDPATVPVEVRVRSSLSSGVLYVNGKNYGPLRSGGSVVLELVPGSYRLEARDAGDVQAVHTLDLRPGLHADVHLASRDKTLAAPPDSE